MNQTIRKVSACRRSTLRKEFTLDNPIPSSRIGIGEAWGTTVTIPERLMKEIQLMLNQWVVPTVPKDTLKTTAGTRMRARRLLSNGIVILAMRPDLNGELPI